MTTKAIKIGDTVKVNGEDVTVTDVLDGGRVMVTRTGNIHSRDRWLARPDANTAA